MSLVANVVDGVLQTTTSDSDSKSSKSGSTTLNKNDFLQLLVAQMKYQDPLEPTSNTEYVSQFAQYSQVEELQNMSSTMAIQRASGLVGQTVRIATTTSTGDTNYVTGTVDYVSITDGKANLSVNGNLYSVDDLDTVVNSANNTSSIQQAASLVGKTVRVGTLSSDGEIEYVTGVVDYVKVNNGVAYMSIKDTMYSMDNLDEIINPTTKTTDTTDTTDTTKTTDTTDTTDTTNTTNTSGN